MAGLAPDTLRLVPKDPETINAPGVSIDVANDDAPDLTADAPVLTIENDDGSVTISIDGRSLVPSTKAKPSGWFDNLVDDIDASELSRIADELKRGIDSDIQSRVDWIESYSTGIRLLGFKLETPGVQGGADGAPVEGMSKVRHSLLAEAVLRFQANARSEMLPTDGPVKVRDDHNGNPPSQMGHNGGPPIEGAQTGSTLQQDRLADALERDLNHYLTTRATEYYPDTDRMLLKLGFGGTSFKKGYFCPLRSRPVLETVDADDLIVNNSATDLKNAKRVTHRIYMRPSTVKRLQILGVYREISLSTPNAPDLDAVQRQEKEQQGISQDSALPEDRDREIYECYCELDIKEFEHTHKGKISGLEIPYRVTLDVSSQEILSIVRNYNEDTKALPEPRTTFVKYTYVPGFGFYDIGLLHILGNTTNALTAGIREMLDNGMYANFPGFLISKQASRQNTNILRVPPGGSAQVDTLGGKIQDAVMPLPYETAHMGPLMALLQYLEQGGQRIGGTSELQVGEGRADAPVGTTLAMIDQATKVMNSVHKRMHASQAEEFKLLVELFREHPESFVGHKHASGQAWTEEVFLKALTDYDLVPQADPNTASHSQRIMKGMALKQLQDASPNMYNPVAVDTALLEMIGFSNPEQFLAPPQALASPPPELQEIQAGIKTAAQVADAKTQEANAKTEIAKAKTAEVQAKAAQGGFAPKPGLGEKNEPSSLDQATAQAKLLDAETNAKSVGLKAHETQIENQNRDQDRASREKLEVLGLAKDIALKHADLTAAVKQAKTAEKEA